MFSIFQELGYSHAELFHSRMIKIIASHDGARELFWNMLERKLEEFGIDSLPAKRLKDDVIATSYKNWIVNEGILRENVGGKIRDRGRADILISNKARKGKPSYRIIIENKLDAVHQPHQLRKYYRYLTGNGRVYAGLFYLCNKWEMKKSMALLSAEPYKSESRKEDATKFAVLTYEKDIRTWLEAVLQLDIDFDFLAAVKQYLELIKHI
jgi:hypothetical protein